MTEYTAFRLIERLKTTLTSRPPYCSGVLEVAPRNFELYYGRNEARFIDLLETSTSNDHGAIEELTQACERAGFGRGQETVLDETYRKAGKMDSTNFITRLDLESTRLLATVRLGLLPGAAETRTVRAELYKLNVYGEGAFFKPHKDTPHSQSMFGSLVVIFPTPHEGGALVLRHENEEFTFDAATLLSGRTNTIAYVAFFSDVEHEVMPVVSGHRVTLTYNLYYGSLRDPAPPTNLEALQPPHASAATVKEVLTALLDDSTFLPEGGTLGFSLRHDYPLPRVWTDVMCDPLECLEEWLKGSDAVLFEACTELGVQPLLRLVSEDMSNEIMLDRMVQLEGYDLEDAEEGLREYDGAVVLHSLTFTGDVGQPWSARVPGSRWGRRDEEEEELEELTVHWVTSGGYGEGPRSPHIEYGNEASLNWLYMRVCLLVKIGRYRYRSETGDDDEDEEGVNVGADADEGGGAIEAEENDDERGEGSGNDAAGDAR